MKFPKNYRAPKVENLATKVDVAWGGCSNGGGFDSGTGVCDFNGTTPSGGCVVLGFSTAGCDPYGMSAGPT